MQLASTIGVAFAAGLVARRVRLPGGALFGAMAASGMMTLAWGNEVDLPASLKILTLAMVGMMIGLGVTRARLKMLVPYAAAAVLSATGLIVAGYSIALLLVRLELAPPAVVLATSPGALSVLAAAAIESGEGAAEVVLFHVVRLVVVILLVPIVFGRSGGP